MLQEKYSSVLELGQALGVKNGDVQEVDGKLKVTGTCAYALDRDHLWDAIKKHENWENEVEANINFENTDVYGYVTVKSGDSLSKIAKDVYDDASQYMAIFHANSEHLSDPDKIQVGQKLIIPNKA
ncbi:MAG: LysM peptidoglycan-binding domain-containing protein [Chlorobiota bacterium]|jgi:nucleoid-associated protein YgaU|nr:LysM peptidoglycan-binding domain-containing protein [Chlorobiota bacterium]QQS66556.1 MAG: LysM peptidoglycan-binding domain-containing protein [Chlorobiota bacterium]